MKQKTIGFIVDSSKVDNRKEYRPCAFMSDAQDIANIHASAIGFGYKDLITSSAVWVLSRLKVKYYSHPKWEDTVALTTWHKGREGIMSLRDYELTDTQGNILIAATSSWLIIDPKTRKMLRPDHILGERGLETSFEKDAIAGNCDKIRTNFGSILNKVMEHQVRFSDIDMNAHTNNTKYFEWALDAIDTSVTTSHAVQEFQINFNHEAQLGDIVELSTAQTAPLTYYVEGNCSGKNIFQTIIQFQQ